MSVHYTIDEIGICPIGEKTPHNSGLANGAEETSIRIEPFEWIGRVLSHFATAERAIGRLCIALDLPVGKVPLASLQQLSNRLARQKDKQCQKLLKQIEKWQSFRPQRNLLAHASPLLLHDSKGKHYILTHHLVIDRDDVTPDRLWTEEDCAQLQKDAASYSQSIADQVRNLLQNSKLIAELKKPDPGSSPG